MLKICLPQKTERILIALLVVLFVIKLVSTVEAPVLDPSEARYAWLARAVVRASFVNFIQTVFEFAALSRMSAKVFSIAPC